MGKPNQAKILAAPPLTASLHRAPDPLAHCNLCGEKSKELRLYVECDEHDKMIPEPEGLLFVGAEHRACVQQVNRHPRLYRDAYGAPGSFPRLCGHCIHREGFTCTNPKAMKNGGPPPGIKVEFKGMLADGWLCGPGGCESERHAVACAGRSTLRLIVGGNGAAS